MHMLYQTISPTLGPVAMYLTNEPLTCMSCLNIVPYEVIPLSIVFKDLLFLLDDSSLSSCPPPVEDGDAQEYRYSEQD